MSIQAVNIKEYDPLETALGLDTMGYPHEFPSSFVRRLCRRGAVRMFFVVNDRLYVGEGKLSTMGDPGYVMFFPSEDLADSQLETLGLAKWTLWYDLTGPEGFRIPVSGILALMGSTGDLQHLARRAEEMLEESVSKARGAEADSLTDRSKCNQFRGAWTRLPESGQIDHISRHAPMVKSFTEDFAKRNDITVKVTPCITLGDRVRYRARVGRSYKTFVINRRHTLETQKKHLEVNLRSLLA